MSTSNGSDGVIDLTPTEDERTPKRFRVGPQDDDVFTACAGVPVLVAVEGIRLLTARDTDEQTAAERTVAFLERVLYDEDVPRFHERLTDLKRPIDQRLLFRILNRLLEEWGFRPTGPSEPSSDGLPPPDAGMNSTETLPPEVSISSGSPSTGS
jgi:hypothetical protein